MAERKNVSIPVFILAGGLGTRLSEETKLKPKPMVEVGGIPLLVHIMRHYYRCGFDDFVICAGYRIFDIKEYFTQYRFMVNDIELDLRTPGKNELSVLSQDFHEEKWRVRILDTGLLTKTGGRLARAFDKIDAIDPIQHFAVTYGDGLSNVDLSTEFRYHLSHGVTGTVLGVKNVARFGELEISENSKVTGFLEKPDSRQGEINGGFFFFHRDFRKYLDTREELSLEREPLMNLASDGGLRVFKNSDFWHPVDTLRDKDYLQSLWDSGKAPWTKALPVPTDFKGEAACLDPF